MNKERLNQLNVIPEGKEAWLSYDQYETLRDLFESISLPSDETGIQDSRYLKLYDFLTQVARLNVPMNEAALHFNAFVLLRRGYKPEEITSDEYERLAQLMSESKPADVDDLVLYDFGGHRALYDFLTQGMGLSVKRGRGPVWHRGRDLMRYYESNHL